MLPALSLSSTLRALGRAPGFLAAALASLALGIGLNTAAFTLLDRMTRGSCTVDARGLVRIHGTEADRSWVQRCLSGPDVREILEGGTTLEHGTALRADAPVWVRESGEAVRLQATQVGPAYFDLVGTRPALGRIFRPEDRVSGAAPVAILSHHLWKARFGARPDILGQRLRLDGREVEVVGVMPARFAAGGLDLGGDLWTPLPQRILQTPHREACEVFVGARLRTGATPQALQAELDRLGALQASQHPSEEGRWRLGFSRVGMTGSWWEMLLPLLIPGTVLVVACANVSGLLYARGVVRQREVAVRAALGATPAHLASVPLAEALALGLGGGLLGLVLAWGLLQGALALLPAGAALDELGLDGRALATALGFSLVAVLGCALLPVLRAHRVDLVHALKGVGAFGARGLRTRRLLVAVQVGVATLMVGGCGLILHHALASLQRDPGARTRGLARTQATLPEASFGEAARKVLRTSLEAHLQAHPDHLAHVFTFTDPYQPGDAQGAVTVEGAQGRGAGRGLRTDASAGWPATFGIPLRAGRDFLPGEARVCLVNEAFLRQWGWTPLQALGARVGLDRETLQVVGVVSDHVRLHKDQGIPEVVVALPADLGRQLRCFAATRGRSATMGAHLDTLLARLAPARLEASTTTVEALRLAYHREELTLAALVGGCGLLGLGLAGLGLQSLVAYLAALQSRDHALRGALGLSPLRLGVSVCLEGGRLALWGLVPGLLGTLALGQVLARMVPGLVAMNPLVLGATGLVLTLAGLLACVGTALKVARIAPGILLKAE